MSPAPFADIAQALQQKQFKGALQLAKKQLNKPGPYPFSLLQMAAQAAMQLNDEKKAEYYWRMAITCSDQQGEALVGLGELLEKQQRFAEAHMAFRTALGLNPNLATAHHGAGRLLEANGQLNIAGQAYHKTLELQPGLHSARFRLGRLQQRLGEYAAAQQAYTVLLNHHPTFHMARFHLAEVQQRTGALQAAEQNYRQVIQDKPDFPEAHNQLANLFNNQQQYAQAITHYQAAIDLRPDVALFHYNLGYVYFLQNQHAKAADYYAEAVRINPKLGGALGSLILCDMMLCRWDRLDHNIALVKQLLTQEAPQQDPALVPFITTYLPEIDAQLQRRAAQQFTQASYGGIIASPPLVDPQTDQQGDRLRIGYLSADFRNHAISRLCIGVLEQHNRSQFEIHAFAIGPDTDDAMRQRVKQTVDQFHCIGPLDDASAARAIAEQHVDILVDMMGYTTHARPGILAYRPAPLQVSWLGYPGGMGHQRLADYLVGDPINTPAEEAHLHAEQLAIMPHCYQPNPREMACDPTPTRSQAGLPPQGIVFGSFNQSYKITPTIVATWSALLTSVPDSVLWLLDHNLPEAITNLHACFAHHNIAKHRVIFAPRVPMAAHMGRLPLVDVALDTFPYGSHTTGSDTLWSGVPLVVWQGDTFASRVSSCLATNMGMTELITHDQESYLALARTLANDPSRRASIRQRLLAARDQTPLYNSPLFTHHLENLYQRMWGNHRQGLHQLIQG
ncbi:tetratricopeptide repeat protein [Magnetococcus sp. PR-3]|uniref:tetratricopeptide repeat protein n=1 Tax=Magnetococcus sp. PR-3 TaxID=3120355 RepID=UPI002FCE4CE8